MYQNPYIRFIRSWFALILLGIIVSVIATHYALGERVPLHRATATIQVGRMLDEKNPTTGELAVIDRLVPLYGEMASREPVLQAVIDQLDLEMTPADIQNRLVVTPMSQTQLIDIQVVDADPELAAAIANGIAGQIVTQAPGETLEGPSADFVAQQLSDLQTKITGAQEEATELQETMLTLTGASQVFDAEQRMGVLNAQIDAWQQSYASLLGALEPSTANVVQVVTEATPSTTPLPQQTALYYGLAVIVGGGLSTLLALGLSTLGRAIADPREVSTLAGDAPVVAIPRYKVARDGTPVTLEESNVAAIGAYRILRNTLRLRQGNKRNLTLAVTSSRSGEGKTTTVANLGVTLANSGLSVLLVDANLRNPELDYVLGVDGTVGFADVLLGDTTVDKVKMPTRHPKLWVIGAGSVPVNFEDLLSSVNLSTVVSALLREADAVIFDTPAIAQEQETQLLVQHITGVLVIAESGRVKEDDLEETLEILQRTGTTVMAIALNKTRARRWNLERLPWSRESRLQARADAQRQRHTRAMDAGDEAMESAAD